MVACILYKFVLQNSTKFFWTQNYTFYHVYILRTQENMSTAFLFELFQYVW